MCHQSKLGAIPRVTAVQDDPARVPIHCQDMSQELLIEFAPTCEMKLKKNGLATSHRMLKLPKLKGCSKCWLGREGLQAAAWALLLATGSIHESAARFSCISFMLLLMKNKLMKNKTIKNKKLLKNKNSQQRMNVLLQRIANNISQLWQKFNY